MMAACLACVLVVVLPQAALAWEMSISYIALDPGLRPQALILKDLELEGEDGSWRMAKLPCQCSTGDCSGILSQVDQVSFTSSKNSF